MNCNQSHHLSCSDAFAHSSRTEVPSIPLAPVTRPSPATMQMANGDGVITKGDTGKRVLHFVLMRALCAP